VLFCCDEFPISFHQVTNGQKMYMLEYLIYNVQVYGAMHPEFQSLTAAIDQVANKSQGVIATKFGKVLKIINKYTELDFNATNKN
jgi:hypothetical protein